MSDATESMRVADRKLVVDTARCIGCKSCAAACFCGHLDTAGLHYEPAASSDAMPAVCRQCKEAPCVAACPNEAMYVDAAGIVRRSRVRCTGCRSCALACPFGVINADTTRNQVGKCDLCADRTPQGLLPRCVAVCPSGALRFMDIAQAGRDGAEALVSGRTVYRSV